MEKETIIKVENLGKKYKIGEKERYLALRDSIVNAIKLPYKILTGKKSLKKLDFWALKNISFEVKRGEVVGIIGRNGAGKTTLLKILSRITEPTTGKVTLKGRVASLLEVGTGFHPELTGRENVYLNGAILGMRRLEINRKFDEIVDFSGVEKFIDTPVKRYSSGMYVRLAFAIAAHLEPEILLVDEVLAVGDTSFQKKCLGKMKDVASAGRTVLFVSHNMAAVKRLCSVAMLLVDGKAEYVGRVDATIHKYLNKSSNQNAMWKNNNYNNSCNYLKPLMLCVYNKHGNVIQNSANKNEQIIIVFEFDLLIKQRDLTIGISIFDENNQHLFRTLHTDSNENINEELKIGNNRIICELPIDILNEGTYLIKLDGGIYKKSWDFNPFTDDEISIKIELNGDFTFSGYWQNRRNGLLAPKIRWKVK